MKTWLSVTRRAALAGALVPALALGGAPVDSGHAQARLLSALEVAVPGQRVDVALHLELDRGWHTYWQNPGDSGLPVRLDWTLPPGVRADPIEWPVPERIPSPPFMTYGYADRVTLPARLHLDASWSAGQVLTLAAQAHYLVCREVCLPEHARLELSLAVDAQARPDRPAQAAIARARARLPRQLPELAVRAGRHAGRVYLQWNGNRAGPALTQAYFFAADPLHLEYAAPQPLRAGTDGPFLELTPATLATAPVQRLRGVLSAAPGLDAAGQVPAVSVDVPVAQWPAAPQALNAAPVVATPGAALAPGLALALALAFAGGLVLNLMPCVFPVLAIKAAGLAAAAGGRARAAGLAYAGGVLVSVWVLAGALLALRGAGSAVGWGFQLQSAPFVATLALLMTAVGVNLLGAFEAGNVLAARAGAADRHAGLSGAFASGVLAVLLATPCTAPFMAAALGYALAQPAGVSLAVFTALGLGLAAPFLLLAEVPGVAARLPRPGAWMVRLRQGLAFPMLATALWLAWVYGRQRGADGAAVLLAAALTLGFALWALGLVQQRGRSFAWAALLVGALACAALFAAALRMAPAGAQAVAPGTLAWSAWSAAAVARERAAGRPVFVDFTADWCLTCKVNERVALADARVVRAFAARGVAALKADWTAYDPAITAALAGFGRSGVPVYVYYPPGGQGQLLPELLTPGIVLRALGPAP